VTLSRAAAALAALCLGLSACSNGPRLGESESPMVVTQLTELPPPDGFDAAGDAFTYRIAPLDKLSLIVADVPELTGLFRTDSRGNFVLPYIGEVATKGLTPAELSAQIESRLRSGNYINDPHVAVNIEEADSLAYTIDGQVNDPGDYSASPDLTLMRAIAKAKGLNEYARLDDVVVFRTAGGQSFAALYDLDAIRDGLYADPRIYPRDMVVVGDQAGRRQLQQFVQSLPLLTTPIVLALQRCC
jgi:polysaccharide export outer membrane protein